jgi:hypothetical protein
MRSALEANIAHFGDLGEIDERILIEQGVVTDRYKEYFERSDYLPPEQLIGPANIPMTKDEAKAWLIQEN